MLLGNSKTKNVSYYTSNVIQRGELIYQSEIW